MLIKHRSLALLKRQYLTFILSFCTCGVRGLSMTTFMLISAVTDHIHPIPVHVMVLLKFVDYTHLFMLVDYKWL